MCSVNLDLRRISSAIDDLRRLEVVSSSDLRELHDLRCQVGCLLVDLVLRFEKQQSLYGENLELRRWLQRHTVHGHAPRASSP